MFTILYTTVHFFNPVKSKKNKVHRGQLLAAAVEGSRLNKEEVAEKAGYSRSAYYKHIDNADLDYHILIAYGRAIGHDFTEELPEMPKYLMEEPEGGYNKPLTIEEAVRQRDHWKDKYIELLEKYNRLIENKNPRV